MDENITDDKNTDYICGCMVCGDDLIYLPDKTFRLQCFYCGKEADSRVFCLNGHYVCDECHSKGILGFVEQACIESDLTNPLKLAEEIFDLPGLHMHGPEYHSIVPAVIVAAHGNLSHNKRAWKIKEAIRRGKDLVGGLCGSHGACGASLGVGIAYAIINNVDPLSVETRGIANKMSALALLEISPYGGPRCCKRDAMLSLEVAVKNFECFADKNMISTFKCNQVKYNNGCIGKKCPYFPQKEK